MPKKNEKKIVSQLVEMGFDEYMACIALIKNDYNKEQAINDLFEKKCFKH